jgi:hypothetical protein
MLVVSVRPSKTPGRRSCCVAAAVRVEPRSTTSRPSSRRGQLAESSRPIASLTRTRICAVTRHHWLEVRGRPSHVGSLLAPARAEAGPCRCGIWRDVRRVSSAYGSGRDGSVADHSPRQRAAVNPSATRRRLDRDRDGVALPTPGPVDVEAADEGPGLRHRQPLRRSTTKPSGTGPGWCLPPDREAPGRAVLETARPPRLRRTRSPARDVPRHRWLAPFRRSGPTR